jgi:hypothetical protein
MLLFYVRISTVQTNPVDLIRAAVNAQVYLVYLRFPTLYAFSELHRVYSAAFLAFPYCPHSSATSTGSCLKGILRSAVAIPAWLWVSVFTDSDILIVKNSLAIETFEFLFRFS